MAKNLYAAQIRYKYLTDKENEDLLGVDLVERIGAKAITSLGVQAPNGTHLIINGCDAYVGPTGVFELSDVVEITSLVLSHTPEYQNPQFVERVIIDILYEKKESE